MKLWWEVGTAARPGKAAVAGERITVAAGGEETGRVTRAAPAWLLEVTSNQMTDTLLEREAVARVGKCSSGLPWRTWCLRIG